MILDDISTVCNFSTPPISFYNNSWAFVEWEPVLTFQCHLFIILWSNRMRVSWVQLLNFNKLTSDLWETSCRRGKCWKEVSIAEIFIITAEFTGYTGHRVTGQTLKNIPVQGPQIHLLDTSGNKSQYKVIVLMQTSDFSVSISRIISMMHLPLYMSWSDHLLQSYSLHAIKSTVYLCILIHNCNKCNYLTWLLFFKFLTLRL